MGTSRESCSKAKFFIYFHTTVDKMAQQCEEVQVFIHFWNEINVLLSKANGAGHASDPVRSADPPSPVASTAHRNPLPHAPGSG